jgi:hypothetical protein
MNRLTLTLTLLILACLPAAAVDRITASISITNAPTTNGMTFAVNGNTRTWTNSVVTSSTQIATNATAAGSKTNLFNQIALNPFLQVSLLDVGSTNFQLVAASGVALTVTPSAGYASVSYSTQTVTSLVDVRVPVSGEPTAAARTNISSGIVAGINRIENTNAIDQTSVAATQLVGTTNTQTITGPKDFSNAAGIWRGIVSNSPAISGKVFAFTNGYYTNGFFDNPALTNAVNYGLPFSSPGSGTASEQYGQNAVAAGSQAVALGNSAMATTPASLALGTSSLADGTNAIAAGTGADCGGFNAAAFGSQASASGVNGMALGHAANTLADQSTGVGANTFVAATHTNSTALGYGATTTKKNQVRLGTSTNEVSVPGNLVVDGGAAIAGGLTDLIAVGTNSFPAGADIAFGRYVNSSLANGNNAAVVVGTNVLVDVSGPSGAFALCGIAGGRDGKLVILLNKTGQTMTIANDSGVDPAAANRIRTGVGADVAYTNNPGAVTLIYDANVSRWTVLSSNK